jgi:HemY protein
MSRALFIVLIVALLGTLAAWLADRPGSLVLEWLGWRVETSVGFVLFALVLLLTLTVLAANTIRWILSGPAGIGAFFVTRRKRAGYRALTQGLIAAALGQEALARRQAGRARDKLGEEPLTLLLAAQAAQLSGNHAEAETQYRRMLARPETEALGLHGLFLSARTAGNDEAALDYAHRAFLAAPRSPSVFEGLFALHVKRRQWAEARRVLAGAMEGGLVEGDAARRRQAVLITAEARELAAEDSETARERALALARRALRLSPDLVPAAAIAATVLAKREKVWAASGTIEAIWPKAPHPHLGEIYAGLKPMEGPKARLDRVRGLVALNKGHVESRLLLAREALRAGRIQTALNALVPLTEPVPSARAARLMAEIEGARGRDFEAAGWLSAAAGAMRDGVWRCRECGHEAEDWSALCGHCGAFDGLAWKLPEVEIIPGGSFEEEPRTAETPSLPATPVVSDAPAAPERDSVTEPPAPKVAPADDGKAAAGAARDQKPDAPYQPPRPPDDPGTEEDSVEEALSAPQRW